MEHHVEWGLRLHTEPEYGSLYNWAINEVDDAGRVIGRDQIPWVWRLWFSATSCVLSDGIEIQQEREANEEDKRGTTKVLERQIIHLQLRPGGPGDERRLHRQTTFSMFGTQRSIEDLRLDIRQLNDDAEKERCVAWGSVAYTSEIDFRAEKVDDCIVFYLFITPQRFSRYAAAIANGSIDEFVFSVGLVDGFYSEWSPSISTSNVKVLTRGDEHEVRLPLGLGFEPPRLGAVGGAELYLNRRLEFVKRTRGAEAEEAPDEGGTMLGAREMPVPLAADVAIVRGAASLRRIAWFIATLLTLILLVLLMRR